MGSIRSAIELQDNFTGVLYQVIDSVNLGLSAMEDLHRAMDSPVDADAFQAARDSINQAAVSVRELASAMDQVDSPEIAPAVSWQSPALDVFGGSGIDRFRQEVQSTDAMLERLCSTQDAIARQAYNTSIFPPEAFRDLNAMAVRIDGIRGRIQQIEGNPLNMGTDAANAELEMLRGQLEQALREQQDLNRAVEDMDVQAANESYLRLQQAIGDTERHIRDNVDEQGRFNRQIEEGANGADGLMGAIKGAVAAYATLHTLSNALGLSDQLTSTTARLDMMNDGLQTTQELQDMIFLSAERARGSYQATADAVSKLGLMAGDAFSSSEEVIAFMEQVNKQFRIAGTEAAGIDAAMLQLTQAMGSGVLRGEEYNSILEQAPNIIQAIADYLEVPKGELKDMAAEGIITADIVKAAMFAAADETNAKFESMPKTFEQIWTSFENHALMAFQPVLERMNEIGNSEAFQVIVDNAIGALSAVAGIALEIFDLMVGGAQLVADNWSWLSPIIYGVAGALAVYYGWQMAVNAIDLISKGIHVAMAVAQMIHAAATGALTAATAAEIAAQNGLNAAMYACPVTWIIIAIIALIAILYAAVAAVNHFAGTSVSATGIICGVFMVAAAFIGNLFVTLINFVIDLFVVLWNFIAAFVNFFGNVFTDPVGSIARLFFDLVDCILGLLESLASAIDTIFGSNLAGAVSGWRDSLGGWVDGTFGQGEEIMAKMDASSLHLGRFEYKGAWDAGYSFGRGIDESIAGFDPASLFGTNIPDAGSYTNLSSYGAGMEGIGSGVEDIAGNTGAIADSMEITGEELKYLRDIAEQEAVNRFTTAEINIEQTNHNTIKNGMDLDGIMSGMTDMVNEAIDISTEGVHV
nr:tape measure protein [uncultured Acetatifactor sp.]